MDELFAKVYVDENMSKFVAKLLRDNGFDAVSASEISNTNLSDTQQLIAAVSMKRVILTADKRNFVANSNSRNINHFGIIIVPRQYKTSLLNSLVKKIINSYLNRYTLDEFKNAVFYL